ncbi:MAG: DEAD/DEAH box helicase family protein, partial [Sulfuriferula sp.]
GVLFTNGTGTGKTYLGLGIAKRMVRQGKSNGLIVVPNDKMVEDWTDSAKNLGLTVRALDGVKDPGKGIAVTTYANFGQNLTLADRPIDWVITDESHNLMQNAQATDTESLNALQAITLHPDGIFDRARMLHRDLRASLDQAQVNYTALSKARKGMTDAAELKANGIATEAAKTRLDAILAEWAAKVAEVKAHIAAHQGKDRPRVVMLSATPFAYEKNVSLAAGYLYQLGEQNTSGGYNTPSPMGAFMIQHFGYRMRYGKLTTPDANVDSGLMQRQFNTYLRKEGVLSARILDVDYDYDRKFVLIPSAIGRKIDEGLEYLREEDSGRYYPLYEAAQKKFDYLSRLRLLEALKAEAAVSYIKEHHALGRKVVVFHDYNDGGAFNPFSFSQVADDNVVTSRVKNAETGAAETATVKVNDLINEFNAKRPDLADINLNGYSNPIATLTRAFPDAMQFNGRIPKKERRQNIQQFNDDSNPHANLLIVQSAANAGWSGHDTTGKHQRVVLNLGLPTAPTKAIQQEGRIYRVGQASDALFRYMNTGTSWERMAFASTIARRASAAENMAMGEQARGLLD